MNAYTNFPLKLQLALPSGTNGDGVIKNMNLRETLQIIRCHLRLIICVAIAGAALGLFLALFLTPQYRAETIVMLDARKARVVNTDAVVSGLPAENSSLRSEIDIIESRRVIDHVIDKLGLMDNDEFNGKRLEWLEQANPTTWFRTPLSPDQVTMRTRTKVAQSIGKRLQVDNDGRSLSIRISFESEDPAEAAKISNAIANEYIIDQLDAKYETIARTNTWLNDRLTTLKQQLEISEKKAEDFRQKAKLIEVDGSTMAARQMEEVNNQLVAARSAVSEAEARLRNTQEMVRTGGEDAAAEVLASPLIQHLREQEAEVRRNEADLAARYGEKHPKMIHAQADFHELEVKIAEEVQKIIHSYANELDIARAKERSLEKQLQNRETQAGEELRDTVTLRQLEREALASRTIYENFLARFKQTGEQEEGLQLADSTIVAPAEPPIEPYFPIKSLFVAIGAILGCFAGLLAAYLIEYLDRGFREISQLEETLGVPAIGLIPALDKTIKQPPQEYILQKPLSSYSEALRTVRTAIRFSNVDHPPKTIMVTSALQGEGKTTFCLSLCRSLAIAGNKILLIDADMRRPDLATLLGSDDAKKENLASLLTGESTFANTVEHDAASGLDFIAARGIVANAQDLLGSDQMKKMIRYAADHYDLVVIDTPPVLAVSDALMIMPAADTTIFIVKWAETPRELAAQAMKQIKSAGCKIAGVVLTQVDVQQHTRYSYSARGYYAQYSQYHTN